MINSFNRKFVLVVTYACGEGAFITDTDDLEEALKQFKENRMSKFKDYLSDKSSSLPLILSAKIVPVL